MISRFHPSSSRSNGPKRVFKREPEVLPIDSDDERVIFIDGVFRETGSSVSETLDCVGQ